MLAAPLAAAGTAVGDEPGLLNPQGIMVLGSNGSELVCAATGDGVLCAVTACAEAMEFAPVDTAALAGDALLAGWLSD